MYQFNSYRPKVIFEIVTLILKLLDGLSYTCSTRYGDWKEETGITYKVNAKNVEAGGRGFLH
jgi:hypothetical protein